jgi:hypothetical protein
MLLGDIFIVQIGRFLVNTAWGKMRDSNRYHRNDGFVHGDVSATVGLRINTRTADSNLVLCIKFVRVFESSSRSLDILLQYG